MQYTDVHLYLLLVQNAGSACRRIIELHVFYEITHYLKYYHGRHIITDHGYIYVTA